jgi:hypothetical protein
MSVEHTRHRRRARGLASAELALAQRPAELTGVHVVG